jgi:hypothetical protein
MAPDNTSIDELLAQLPQTDKQIEAALPPPPPDAPKKKREPDPDPGAAGSKFTAPDAALAETLAQKLLGSGRKNVAQLIGRIRDVTDPAFDDYRPEYLLHLAVVYAGSAKGMRYRRALAGTLTDQIRSSKLSHGVRQILIRELEWIGGAAAIDELAALLGEDEHCAEASAALLAIGKEAVPAFRKALPKAASRCRSSIVLALGQFRDTKSVEMLRRAMADSEMDVRLSAAWALARLGDAQSAKGLLALAGATSGYSQAKATQAVLMLAENLTKAGKKNDAHAIYAALRGQTKEKYIRDVAGKALAKLEAA